MIAQGLPYNKELPHDRQAGSYAEATEPLHGPARSVSFIFYKPGS